MKILLLIRSLNAGGTEKQLIYLARGLKDLGYEVHVAVFYQDGTWDSLVKANSKIHFHCLEKRGRWDVLSFIWSFKKLIQVYDFDVVYGFLPSGNLIASLAKRFYSSKRPKVAWGIRVSKMDYGRYGLLDILLEWTERCLAPGADRIIVNSQKGLDICRNSGFPADKLFYIANGIDTETYVKTKADGLRIRTMLGIPAEASLIGIVARIDPMKDHETFLRAAALLAKRKKNAKFICIGGQTQRFPGYFEKLQRLASKLKIADQIYWAGHQQDIVSWINALDFSCSASSFGEGFSNAVGEVMACEIPCVVTDVGDSAVIVGDAGRVVPPGEPRALADALLELSSLSPDEKCLLGLRARSRIVEHFSIGRMVNDTDAALRGLHYDSTMLSPVGG